MCRERVLCDVTWAEAEQCPRGGEFYAHSEQWTSFGQVGTGPRTSSSVSWKDGDALNRLEKDGVGGLGHLGMGWGAGGRGMMASWSRTTQHDL